MKNLKYILRRMRFVRTLFYDLKFSKEWHLIPSDIRTSSIEKIKSSKDKYKGQRCFIIGNGPSLSTQDLDKLKNEYSFASNRIYTLYNNTIWRPTFFATQDEEIIRSISKSLSFCAQNSEQVFINMRMYPECNREIVGNNIIWMPLKFVPPKNKLYKFSNDVSREIYEGLTITYSCMQLAVYMGFSEIYLLGVDHNYGVTVDDDGNVISDDQSVCEYFNEAKSVEIKDRSLPKVVEMTRAYNSAELFSRGKGFKIYNATRGGKLDIYERVDFDSLF